MSLATEMERWELAVDLVRSEPADRILRSARRYLSVHSHEGADAEKVRAFLSGARPDLAAFADLHALLQGDEEARIEELYRTIEALEASQGDAALDEALRELRELQHREAQRMERELARVRSSGRMTLDAALELADTVLAKHEGTS